MIKMSKMKLLGIALTVLGTLPSIYWAVNFVQSKAVRASDILWGAPILCIGAFLLSDHEQA